MKADRDPIDLKEAQKPLYSYASVVDTFFWGEKRQYLPRFQSADLTSKAHSLAPARRLRIIVPNTPAVNKD